MTDKEKIDYLLKHQSKIYIKNKLIYYSIGILLLILTFNNLTHWSITILSSILLGFWALFFIFIVFVYKSKYIPYGNFKRLIFVRYDSVNERYYLAINGFTNYEDLSSPSSTTKGILNCYDDDSLNKVLLETADEVIKKHNEPKTIDKSNAYEKLK